MHIFSKLPILCWVMGMLEFIPKWPSDHKKKVKKSEKKKEKMGIVAGQVQISHASI